MLLKRLNNDFFKVPFRGFTVYWYLWEFNNWTNGWKQINFFPSNFQFFELIIKLIKALPEIDSITKAGKKNLNIILFIRGKAISAAPNIRGTNQFPNPSIKMGMCTVQLPHDYDFENIFESKDRIFYSLLSVSPWSFLLKRTSSEYMSYVKKTIQISWHCPFKCTKHCKL